jgi:hypothetical protein
MFATTRFTKRYFHGLFFPVTVTQLERRTLRGLSPPLVLGAPELPLVIGAPPSSQISPIGTGIWVITNQHSLLLESQGFGATYASLLVAHVALQQKFQSAP